MSLGVKGLNTKMKHITKKNIENKSIRENITTANIKGCNKQ